MAQGRQRELTLRLASPLSCHEIAFTSGQWLELRYRIMALRGKYTAGIMLVDSIISPFLVVFRGWLAMEVTVAKR